MSYIRYLCLLAYSGVQFSVVVFFLRLVYALLPVPLDSIFDCPFGIL
jgi:hypothetical protein